jgi:hypothetical protein
MENVQIVKIPFVDDHSLRSSPTSRGNYASKIKDQSFSDASIKDTPRLDSFQPEIVGDLLHMACISEACGRSPHLLRGKLLTDSYGKDRIKAWQLSND